MKKQHQHFIPQTYLRKFAHTQNGDTFLVDAYNKLNDQTIADISVRDLCVETDLYTLKHLEGEERYSIENFFSQSIKSRYPKIYRLLVEDKKRIISVEERVYILYTTLSMYFRTPKVLNQFISFGAEILEQVNNNPEVKSMNFLGYEISVESKTFEEIKKEIREKHRINYIKTQLEILDQFISLRSFDALVVIELVGDQEFVTSDNPVEIRNSIGSKLDFELFDLKNSIYIPLDPKHALFIAPRQEETIVNQVFYQRDNFFQHVILNHCVSENAERWVIGTKNGIEGFHRDQNEYNRSSYGDHPILNKFSQKLELMHSLATLSEKGITNENVELIDFIKNLKNHELFEESIEFKDAYNQMKKMGLKI